MDEGKREREEREEREEGERECKSSKTLEQTVEYANPRAPEHVKAPVFSVPLSKRMQKTFGTMTPRAVTASIRAYSSVVMTPHAESSSTTDTVPRLKASSGRVMRGPKESAPDRSIFSKDEGENYVDRAAERRAAVKRETGLKSERRSKDDDLEDDGWEVVSHGEQKKEKSMRMELDETQILKIKENKSESMTRPLGSSKMIDNMCQIMGLPLLGRSSKSTFSVSSSNNKFADGKMAYIYDVMSNTPPKTLLQNRVKRMETVESVEIVNVISAVFAPKPNISQPTKIATDPDEDIFPDAGEYVPVLSSTASGPDDRKESKPPIQILFDKTASTNTTSGSHLPKSIENIIDRQGFGKEEAPFEHGYEECYPETDIFYNSDDDEASPSTLNTKRQQRRKESQKLEKQVKKVAKILSERRKEQ